MGRVTDFRDSGQKEEEEKAQEEEEGRCKGAELSSAGTAVHPVPERRLC